MTGKVSLAVNDVSLNLDYFVNKYLYCVAGGIIASLHDTGEIEELDITLDNTGEVKITLNGGNVSLKPFPVEIIRSTLLGMVSPLKGIDAMVKTLELTITK
jgi:hypothetical protein